METKCSYVNFEDSTSPAESHLGTSDVRKLELVTPLPIRSLPGLDATHCRERTSPQGKQSPKVICVEQLLAFDSHGLDQAKE